MAYHTSGYYGDDEIYSSSIGVLDGIPFKINSHLIPLNQVSSLTTVRNRVRPSKNVTEDYTFDIEEGVLKWADERERQLELQRQIEEEQKLSKQTQQHTVQNSDSEEDVDDWLKSSNQNLNKPVETSKKPPKPKPPVPPRKSLQPIAAGIGNEILTPVQTDSQSVGAPKEKTDTSVDVSLFEREEDPFDRYERQTLNELEELKNVFSVSSAEATNGQVPCSSEQTYENLAELHVNLSETDNTTNSGDKSDSDEYENVQLQSIPLKVNKTQGKVDVSKLPSVDQSKNFLAGKIPLPPIGGGPAPYTKKGIDHQQLKGSVASDSTENVIYENVKKQTVYENVSMNCTSTDVSYSAGKLAEPNVNVHKLNPYVNQSNGPEMNMTAHNANSVTEAELPSYENVVLRTRPKDSAGIRNAQSYPDVSISVDSTNPWAQEIRELREQQQSQTPPALLSKTPPPRVRPSSNQSWNRFSPLPNPVWRGESPFSEPSNPVPPMDPNDPYLSLSPEEKHAVDKLVSMGFKGPLAARAIQLYGKDEKEIIDFLCGVNKLLEKGFDAKLSETSLKIYKNDLSKAEEFLTLVKQFKELGFSQDKIQDALVNHNLDRDKALDYLITV